MPYPPELITSSPVVGVCNRGRNCVLSDDEKLIKPWVRSEHAKDEGWVDWTGKPPLFKNEMITQNEHIVIGGVEVVLNGFLT